MQIFLLQPIDSVKALLNEQESKHCIKVLRHKKDDLIHCIDGKGTMYRCKIEEANVKQVQLSITSQVENWGETTQKIKLALSPLRLKDRFEWAIEKAVELGVDEIYPIICHRTDLYKSKFKPSRIETLLLSATKQCKRSRIPHLHPPLDYEDFLRMEIPGMKLMGYCEAETPLQKFAPEIQESHSLTMLIGPEGDFTEEECQLAIGQGIHLVSLGENRLRTETAAIFALSSLKYLWGY